MSEVGGKKAGDDGVGGPPRVGSQEPVKASWKGGV